MLEVRLKSVKLLNDVRENGGYCLCAVERASENRCLCRAFRAQVTPGVCQCGVWEKVETNPTPADEIAREQAERSAADLSGHDL